MNKTCLKGREERKRKIKKEVRKKRKHKKER